MNGTRKGHLALSHTAEMAQTMHGPAQHAQGRVGKLPLRSYSAYERVATCHGRVHVQG